MRRTAKVGHPTSSHLPRLSRWLAPRRSELVEQVHVRKRSHGRETAVSIDHRLSCELDWHSGWHTTTAATFLPLAHFSSQARAYVKTAERLRGRAIYILDEDANEVVAAVAYHLDENPRMPLLITSLGVRIDTAGNPFLRYRTLAGALVLKQYLHAISERTGRGRHVDIDLPKNREQLALAHELGFRRAPRIKGFQPGGVHLRQTVKNEGRADNR